MRGGGLAALHALPDLCLAAPGRKLQPCSRVQSCQGCADHVACRYCGPACAKQHWKHHKASCKRATAARQAEEEQQQQEQQQPGQA